MTDGLVIRVWKKLYQSALPVCVCLATITCGPTVSIAAINTASSSSRSPQPQFPKIANIEGYRDIKQAPLMSRYSLLIIPNNSNSLSLMKAVKTLNSKVSFLAAIPAGGIDAQYYDGHTYGGWSIYPGWWLTLAGTTLTSSVSATQTEIPVKNAQAIMSTLSTNPYVLVGGETMFVRSVDVQSNTIDVRRGVYSSAAPHAAGTRLAAHVGQGLSWRLNLSSDCPENPSTGDTWSDYLVPRATSIVKSASWDGLYLQKFALNSSLINAGDIDTNNDNVPDGGTGTSGTGWSDGESNLLHKLRAQLPSAVIDADSRHMLLGLDGTTLGSTGVNSDWNADQYLFLMSQETSSSRRFSPIVQFGSDSPAIQSFQEMRFELALAVLSNGYDGGGVGSNGSLWIDESDGGRGSSLVHAIGSRETALDVAPNTGSKFQPGDVILVPDANSENGQDEQMLVVKVSGDTLLVKRGYNHTQVSSHVTAAQVVTMSQLRRGAGWLGHPLGVAKASVLTSANQVRNSDFTAGSSDWEFADSQSAQASFQVKNGESTKNPVAFMSVTTADSSNPGNVMLWQTGVSLQRGQPYTLSFQVKSSSRHTITAGISDALSRYSTVSSQSFISSVTWQTKRLTFTPQQPLSRGSLVFMVGGSTGTVSIRDVRLQQGDPNVWRRDFSGGEVILNGTSKTQTVSVGSGYRHLEGTQDPLVNNGQPTSVVTLGPDDAVFLVRQR